MTTAILVSILTAATPLLFAALGELVVERAGVLNLGIEGMMLVGAVVAFAVTVTSGSVVLGVIAGAVAGTLMALGFGLLTLTLLANQVATGLALTIFGIGLSALIGTAFVGVPIEDLPELDIEGISDLPVVGEVVFGHDALVYLGIAMVPAVAWFLAHTRWGLVLRAVGENHDAAHAIGFPVVRVRYAAVAFGGAMAGIGGAYLSTAYTPMWAEEMVAGRGWIALALVVFAAWRPWRVLVGAYLFGGVSILQLHAQGGALFDVPSQVLSMLPYLATIVVLTVISSRSGRRGLAAPGCLGKPFDPFG
ncbi:MAG: ABC transporter permease [Pseudomonadota bacterium]